MQRIFLIGYMGAGKTTVGKQLAAALNLGLVDLDQFIEKRYNKSVSRIFEEKGEEQFREIESRILNEISDFEDVVISTGGGAPCFHNNMQRMNEAGVTIYLKTSAPELAKRLETGKHSRPLIKNKSKEELVDFIEENLRKRNSFYNQASIIFDAEKMLTETDVKNIVAQLVNILCQTDNDPHNYSVRNDRHATNQNNGNN